MVRILTIILAFILLTSCGLTNFVDRMERSHNDLWHNTEAFIVEYRFDDYIYAKSPAGMYTYRIYDKFGKWDDLDTIVVRDYPEVRAYVERIEVNY